MPRKKKSDLAVRWLDRIERMTDAERESIRSQIAAGMILSRQGLATMEAMRVYDARRRVMGDLPLVKDDPSCLTSSSATTGKRKARRST